MSELRQIGGDIEKALETVNVPSYVIDPTGIIRWLNPAARRLVGDVRGRQFTSVVAHEDTRRAREHFARKIAGTAQVTDAQVVLMDPDGGRLQVDISSCPLMQGHRVMTSSSGLFSFTKIAMRAGATGSTRNSRGATCRCGSAWTA